MQTSNQIIYFEIDEVYRLDKGRSAALRYCTKNCYKLTSEFTIITCGSLIFNFPRLIIQISRKNIKFQLIPWVPIRLYAQCGSWYIIHSLAIAHLIKNEICNKSKKTHLGQKRRFSKHAYHTCRTLNTW